MIIRPTLMIGAVAREVVDAAVCYSGRIGIVASRAQVGHGEERGYSGLSGRSLCEAVISRKTEVWRDHYRCYAEDGATRDLRDGFRGVMWDSDYVIPQTLATDRLAWIEAGCGEDPAGNFERRIDHALASGADVRYVSGWLGTCLANGTNSVDREAAAHSLGRLAKRGVPVRAHNCDWLSLRELQWYRDQGVAQFNLAPAIGHMVTTYYAQRDDAIKSNAWREWCYRTHADGRWRRWHASDVRYGMHYLLEQYRRDDWPYQGCVRMLRDYYEYLLGGLE
jgi:hypothetical protein